MWKLVSLLENGVKHSWWMDNFSQFPGNGVKHCWRMGKLVHFLGNVKSEKLSKRFCVHDFKQRAIEKEKSRNQNQIKITQFFIFRSKSTSKLIFDWPLKIEIDFIINIQFNTNSKSNQKSSSTRLTLNIYLTLFCVVLLNENKLMSNIEMLRKNFLEHCIGNCRCSRFFLTSLSAYGVNCLAMSFYNCMRFCRQNFGIASLDVLSVSNVRSIERSRST